MPICSLGRCYEEMEADARDATSATQSQVSGRRWMADADWVKTCVGAEDCLKSVCVHLEH